MKKRMGKKNKKKEKRFGARRSEARQVDVSSMQGVRNPRLGPSSFAAIMIASFGRLEDANWPGWALARGVVRWGCAGCFGANTTSMVKEC